jgi:DNA modification methylase
VSDLVASLKQSAANRAAMEKKFGTIPLSILKINRGDLSRKMFLYQQENKERGTNYKMAGSVDICKSDSAKKRQQERLQYSHFNTGGGSVTDRKTHGGSRLNASTMPAELVAFFVKYYSRPGETYLDPFMGQGVQMQVAKLLGLHYHGYDLSTEFFAYIDAVRGKIDDGKTTLSITHGDSRDPANVPDNVGDFSFHSPPYWDIEFYGTEDGQLGYQQTYEDFLSGMEQVARAWLPKFKSGAWHVVNVNDFRKDGRYYAYHADTISLFRRAGWVLCDTWIIEGLVGGLPKAFAVDFNLKRIAPKVHEYALVFRKP